MMETIKKLVSVISILFLTTSCMDAEKALEGDLIESETLVDSKKFIDQSKLRADKFAKYGPEVVEIDESTVREDTSSQVFKEEAVNYADLKDDGVGNIFAIDLNVENVSIRTFTQMLSKVTGINFLVSDEVSGLVTAKLEGVDWPNALDSVLNLKGYAKHVDNQANIIRIHSQSVIVALESFERQRKTDLHKTAALDVANKPMYTEIFKLFYSKPADVKAILENVLNAGKVAATGDMRSTTAQITIDARVNQIIVKATEEDVELIRKLIKKIDSRTKQVFIEAFVVEVTDDFAKELGVMLGMDVSESNKDDGGSGVKYNVRATGLAGTEADTVSAGSTGASLTDFAVTGATSGIGALFGVGDAADLKVALTALEEDEVSKIISNPRVFTLDNQEATIFQGSEIPYETSSDGGTNVEFKSAGLNLSVTPQVIGDGNLMLKISLNKDSADTSKTNPPITSSSINTNLVTKDGSIVVIGGIYTQTKSDAEFKTPFFGDLPGVGKLFRKDTRRNDKKELMIFIAPKII
jgi:type IV pilus assembly protein PilQ